MAENKRVLFWQETFLPNIGGVEVLAPKLLTGLRKRGYEFIVVTRDDHVDRPTETDCDGIPVHRYPFGAAYIGGNLEQLVQIRSQIAQLKRRFEPDLVHLNLFGPSALFHYDTPNAHRAPVLLTLHTEEDPMLQHSCAADGLFRKALRSAQWVTCVSSATLSYWRQRAPEITGYSSVVYNGFAAPDPMQAPRPLATPRLLFLGRLSPEKGVDLALKAFAGIIRSFPDARLVIAGDGPQRRTLEEQAARMNLAHRVDWLGWVAPENVAWLLSGATMVLLPSRYDGFPSVTVEASLMGRPIVAARVGGIPEIVTHEETGLLVPPDDPNALARAIELLLKEPHRAVALGRAAHQHAQHHFSLDHYVASYDTVYGRLISG